MTSSQLPIGSALHALIFVSHDDSVHLPVERLWEVLCVGSECLLWDYKTVVGGGGLQAGSHGEDPLQARNAAQVRGGRGTLGDGAGAFVSPVSHQRSRLWRITPPPNQLPAPKIPPALGRAEGVATSLLLSSHLLPPPRSSPHRNCRHHHDQAALVQCMLGNIQEMIKKYQLLIRT